MSPEFYTIIGVAIALAGLIINSHRSLSVSMAQMRAEHLEAIGALRTEYVEGIGALRSEYRETTGELRKDLGALGERVARLEGLLEGLRDAITGKAA